MAWIPEQLLTKTLNNERMWSQHLKQFLLLRAGIETKSQEEMDKGARENYIMTEYNRWVEILRNKYPDAAVHPWIKFTTGTRTTQINGKYLYRNFQEGLRVFHRDLNTTWEAVLKEGISGKSKEEVWCRFCYLYWCTILKGIKPDDVTPEGFDVKKVEQKKWVYTFKYMGTCCVFLDLGEGTSHEFLSTPVKLASRGTSSQKRKEKGNPNPPKPPRYTS